MECVRCVFGTRPRAHFFTPGKTAYAGMCSISLPLSRCVSRMSINSKLTSGGGAAGGTSQWAALTHPPGRPGRPARPFGCDVSFGRERLCARCAGAGASDWTRARTARRATRRRRWTKKREKWRARVERPLSTLRCSQPRTRTRHRAQLTAPPHTHTHTHVRLAPSQPCPATPRTGRAPSAS